MSKNFSKPISLPVDVSKNRWLSGKLCGPRSDAADGFIWYESTLFAKACLSKYLE